LERFRLGGERAKWGSLGENSLEGGDSRRRAGKKKKCPRTGTVGPRERRPIKPNHWSTERWEKRREKQASMGRKPGSSFNTSRKSQSFRKWRPHCSNARGVRFLGERAVILGEGRASGVKKRNKTFGRRQKISKDIN